MNSNQWQVPVEENGILKTYAVVNPQFYEQISGGHFSFHSGFLLLGLGMYRPMPINLFDVKRLHAWPVQAA